MKVALIQMKIDYGRQEENLQRAIDGIEKALVEGPDFIILPSGQMGWVILPRAPGVAGSFTGGASFTALACPARAGGCSFREALWERR